ncbi:MAG: DNA internalization-related competence protein ComEC/Rec2 [Bacillota bacterium]|jgi:competence protein ComEC
MPRIIVYHTMAFILGITIGHLFKPSLGIAFVLCLAAFVLSLISLLWKGPPMVLVLFSFCAGGLWLQFSETSYTGFPFMEGDQVQMTGVVVSEPYPTVQGKIFTFKPENINGKNYQGKSLVNVFSDSADTIRYGDYLKLQAKFIKMEEPLNPNQFHYSSYLKRRGITAVVSTAYGGTLTITGINRGNVLLKGALGVKRKMERVLEHLPLRQQTFVAGMLFGDKGNLTYRERNVLSQTGLMDAFAVSGVHVGFVILFSYYLAQILKINKIGRLFLVSFILCFYAAVSGFTPSVLRSGTMAIIGLIAYNLGEKKDALAALAISALLLLIWNPQMLFDSGFQLSFLAAWGVIYLTPALTEIIPGSGNASQVLAATISAQLVLIPLLAYYFNVLTLSGLVMGIFAAGLVGLVVFLGLFSMIICLASVNMAVIPIYGAGAIVEGLWQIANIVVQFPGSYLTVKTPHIVFLVIFYALIVCFPFVIKKSNYGKLYLMFLVSLIIICMINPSGGDGRLNVTFVDVGQGDCIYIQTPRGRRVLIDGGGKPQLSSYDVGEHVVVPFCKNLGISKFDLVINTHPHDDHLNGLRAVIQEMKVDKILIAAPFIKEQETLRLLSWAENRHVPVFPVQRGQEIILEPGIELLVVHPGKEIKGTNADANNNSLVLKLSFLDYSFLFTGDVEKDALAQLAQSDFDLQTDVLKAPHHGSKNSLLPEFLEQVSPQSVVICVGKNSFGHPSAEVLRYWTEKKISVYRTDIHGAITFSTDGKRLFVETMEER